MSSSSSRNRRALSLKEGQFYGPNNQPLSVQSQGLLYNSQSLSLQPTPLFTCNSQEDNGLSHRTARHGASLSGNPASRGFAVAGSTSVVKKSTTTMNSLSGFAISFLKLPNATELLRSYTCTCICEQSCSGWSIVPIRIANPAVPTLSFLRRQ